MYEKLKLMPGVNVYRHEEIPDELHFKNNKYIHDIILKANISMFFFIIFKNRTNLARVSINLNASLKNTMYKTNYSRSYPKLLFYMNIMNY